MDILRRPAIHLAVFATVMACAVVGPADGATATTYAKMSTELCLIKKHGVKVYPAPVAYSILSSKPIPNSFAVIFTADEWREVTLVFLPNAAAARQFQARLAAAKARVPGATPNPADVHQQILGNVFVDWFVAPNASSLRTVVRCLNQSD